MKRKKLQPSSPIPPANDKPLINREEMARAASTYREYRLTAEELAEAHKRCERRGNWPDKPNMFRPRRYSQPTQY